MIQRLLVLAVSAVLLAACAPAPAANPNAPPGGYYVVRTGDTYDSIAAQHRVETAALLQLNNITADAPLRPGQPMSLPAPTLPASTIAAPAPAPAVAPPAAAPVVANPEAPAPPAPDAALEVRPAPPTPFSEEWRDLQLERWNDFVLTAEEKYTDIREGPGGIFIVGGVAIVAGFFALQVLIWIGRALVLALLPLARKLGAFGHELVLNVWYAAWWIGLAFYVPATAGWRLIAPWAEPRARAVGRYALEHGNAWSRRAAAWLAANAKRAAIAVRDEAIDALAELALTRPALRGVSDRLQELAYHRESHAMRARVPGAAMSAWPPAEEELLAALESGAMTAQFTPLLDVRDITVAALESSLRWERADGSVVSDARLATAIERPGYTRIQRSSLAQVLREAAVRANVSGGDGPAPVIAVNLGRAQFADPTLFSTVRAALARDGVDASRLELSVDERSVLADLVAAGEILGQLAEIGVRTTVRDFGALTADQLKTLGVSGVTVDFWNSRRDERVSRYVAESVRTAHELGLPVTATRAETPEEIEFARTLECERLASPPIPQIAAPPAVQPFAGSEAVPDEVDPVVAAA